MLINELEVELVSMPYLKENINDLKEEKFYLVDEGDRDFSIMISNGAVSVEVEESICSRFWERNISVKEYLNLKEKFLKDYTLLLKDILQLEDGNYMNLKFKFSCSRDDVLEKIDNFNDILLKFENKIEELEGNIVRIINDFKI